jgi:hypothetical protein
MISTELKMPERRFKFIRVAADELLPEHATLCSHKLDVSASTAELIISGITNKQILLSKHQQSGMDDEHILRSFTFRDCINCIIICDIPLSGLHLYNVIGSRLVVMGVKGSIHVNGCESLHIEGFCSQLRISECRQLTLHVQTNSSTAIVDSTGIAIGQPPDEGDDERLLPVLRAIGLASESYIHSRKWMNVKDFNWLGDNSKNWHFITENRSN